MIQMFQQAEFSGPIARLRKLLLAMLFSCITTTPLAIYAAATDYTDPAGYPGSWPLDTQWIPYTSSGTNVSDVAGGSGGDASTGGTNPSGAVDIVADYGPAVSWYSDGTNLYFRMQLNSSPLQATGNSKPFTSATWNILLDTDGDGTPDCEDQCSSDPDKVSPGQCGCGFGLFAAFINVRGHFARLQRITDFHPQKSAGGVARNTGIITVHHRFDHIGVSPHQFR